jgi:hypothetical protein
MAPLYVQTLQNMEATLRGLEKRVPAPQRRPFKDSYVYRYVEQTIHQALIQKLARIITGLRAAHLLWEQGFVQEQAALQRMLDEFQEDVTFLAHGVIYQKVSDLHREYLAAFYEEEFDIPDDPVKSAQKRPMVSRRKIRAYLAQAEGAPPNPSRGIEITRTLHKTYSGFIHGASPHIMDMYGGNPPHFHVRGMLGTSRIEEHKEDLWNYFYRGIIAFAFAAKAFGDDTLFDSLRKYRDDFAKHSGMADAVGGET